MSPSIVSSETEIDVPFFDVDLMEIVWHGHYAKYFEIARCDLLDKIDYGYMKMRSSGYAWPIIDLRNSGRKFLCKHTLLNGKIALKSIIKLSIKNLASDWREVTRRRLPSTWQAVKCVMKRPRYYGKSWG
jgi:hypothetical protein